MYINDLSFQGQFKDYDEAMEAMEVMAETIKTSSVMRNNSPIRRKRELKQALISDDKSIAEFFHWLQLQSNKGSSKHRDILQKVLLNLVQGPFIDTEEVDKSKEHLLTPKGYSIADSAIHAALSKDSKSMPTIVSLVSSNDFDCLSFTIDGYDRAIINLVSPDCFNPFLRIYESNPKHELKGSKIVNGKVHSKMDLSVEDAQKVLNNGICIEDKNIIFSFNNECWYQFPSHLECKFHGYPIGTPTNDPNINRIIKEVGQPPYPENGYKVIS